MIMRIHYHKGGAANCYDLPMRRDTAQRRAIRRALEESGRPLAALEVLQGSRRDAPGLGIATVYRTLKALGADGEVTTVELPGEPPRYEAAGKGHHHHFLCERCGKAYELGGCLGGLKELLPRGFKLTTHELLLQGRCAACARGRR